MKVKRKQSNSKNCIVCGLENPFGVKARFYEMEDGSLYSLFQFNEMNQSYPERTHGGMITALIDELIGRAIWINEPDTWGVTMKIDVEFHKPVPYGVPLKGIGRLANVTHLTFEGTGEIYDMQGHLLAKGSALYFKLPLSKITEGCHPEDVNVYEKDNIKEID
jgi:uncharacterized protein (TIGR00369 family)